MQKIGFLGMGVMGLPMAKNVVQKCGLPVLGYDVVQQQMDAFREAGGIPVSDPAEIYKACDVILQILPTHPIIRNSVEQAIQYGKPGNVIVDPELHRTGHHSGAVPAGQGRGDVPAGLPGQRRQPHGHRRDAGHYDRRRQRGL